MRKAQSALVISTLLTSLMFGQVDTVFICDPGDQIQLIAYPGLQAYNWYPPSTLDNPTIYNPTASPIENTTYIVEQLTAQAASDNLILNPTFDSGNDFFTSNYVFVDRINMAGSYGVNTSAFILNPTFFTDCPDHTTGEGPMLIVDGAPLTNQEVWCQEVMVQPNTSYAFSAWLTSVKRENPANLQFFINDQPLGIAFRAGDRVCQWRQFYETWKADASDVAKICIINQNENPQGNDFALDDFSMFELASISYDTTLVLITAVEEVKNRRLYQPNVFSPNTDGMNDTFNLPAGKGVSRIENFRIYNRWGNIVFERENCIPNDPSCSWDGMLKGSVVTQGVYSYIASILYADKITQTIKGEFTLVR